MSNIAGKAYAMNLLTPLYRPLVAVNKLIFWAVGTPLFKLSLRGLQTLSMIHYARWVIVRDRDFPVLSRTQPRERLRYGYMLFCSNFNGSWEQYVDSFAAAIPSGLDLLWFKNVAWPTSTPEQPFHRYVEFNQVWTDYYYSAYPMAASNDVKAGQRVKERLRQLVSTTESATPEAFLQQYNRMLKDLQGDLSPLAATPIVSLAAEDIAARRRDPHATKAKRYTGRPSAPRTSPLAANSNSENVARSNGAAGAREERTDAE
jgi:hypothetical protein